MNRHFWKKTTEGVKGGSLDVWLGPQATRRLTGILCTQDILKNELEVKLLPGCTSKEMELIRAFHTQNKPTPHIPNIEGHT